MLRIMADVWHFVVINLICVREGTPGILYFDLYPTKLRKSKHYMIPNFIDNIYFIFIS